MNKWFNKTGLKSALPVVMSLIVGIVGSWTFSTNPESDNFFWTKFSILAVCSAITIAISIFYGIQDNRSKKEYERLEETVAKLKFDSDKHLDYLQAANTELLELSDLLNSSTIGITKIIEDMQIRGEVSLSHWNYEIYCDKVCKIVYNIICDLACNGKDFSVSIIHLSKEVKKNKSFNYLTMKSHFSNTVQHPKMYNRKFLLKDVSKKFYAKLFVGSLVKPDRDIIILKNADEISKNFTFDDSKSEYEGKYSQYIGIPIVVDEHEGEGGRMIGLLQVIAHGDSRICDKKEVLLEISNTYLCPIVSSIVFVHNVEQGLSLNPNDFRGDKTNAKKEGTRSSD